jgi:hypothetical protein
MKLGLNALIAGVLALALLAPAATAKPGNGSGNGPPAWAGGGSGGANENGKPAWAGQGQEKKAEKAAQRAERRAAAAESDSDAPKHDNPAWVCKFEREQMGAEAFAETYGLNENKANAFGKCVSKEAHDRDGVTAGEEEASEPALEGPSAKDPSEDEPTSEDALAALQAFFQALRQLTVF